MDHTKAYSCHSASLSRGQRPQGITKEARPLRRSPRLQHHLTSQQVEESLTAQECSGLVAQLQPSSTTQPTSPKHKRSREIDTSNQPVQKRQRRTSILAEDAHKELASDDIDSNNPVSYWAKHQQWPQNFLKSEGNMSYLHARKRSTWTLRRRSSASSINTTPTQSDQQPRETKSAQYRNQGYRSLLAAQGSFMGKSELGITDISKSLCQTMLEKEQTVPQESLFRDDLFDETCEKLEDRNEARVIQDISRLVVPSAETLATFGAKHLKALIESVNEGWNNSIPITSPRPQPDYSVGFRREAFTEAQLKTLQPFVGELTDISFFMATYYMYFPFLTCEVKCGAASLDVADRQNAHSMTLAVRAVVELFRLVKREKEIDREILAFSISHDNHSVRIYSHYPVIDGKDTKYYRHPIKEFSFVSEEGKDKWTAYKFTKNVYDNWMPDHLTRICSAINDIPPDVSFDVSQTSFSQELDSHYLSQSEISVLVAGSDDVADSRSMTPNMSPFDRSGGDTPSLGARHMPPPKPTTGQKRARQESGAGLQSLRSQVALMREEKRLAEKQREEAMRKEAEEAEEAALRKELEEFKEWKRNFAIE